MKRLYIAIGMVVFCIIVGIIEMTTINYSSDKCLTDINKIENRINNNEYDKAIKLCEKAAEDYENISANIMFCYYPHSKLEVICQNLSVMAESLKNNDINSYMSLKEKTKKQLNALKEEELFSIQNIL